jgi:hypothetical protein
MFSNMLVAEKRLLEACKKGECLFLGEKRPTEKTDKNEIRGEFLRTLILSNNQKVEEHSKTYVLKLDPSGIILMGAYITGEFNFSYCSTDLPFNFINSNFENEMMLMCSKIKSLSLINCKITSLIAEKLICDSSVFLRNGFESNGEVTFISSIIGGDLDCSNGKFINQNSNALNFEKASINGSVSLSNNFLSQGCINFLLVKIFGNLNCSNSKFYNFEKDALIFNMAKITGGVFFHNSIIEGEINFNSSVIGSNLECINSFFKNSFSKYSLNCEKARISGSVNLYLTRVEGKLNFDSLVVKKALNFLELNLKGDIRLYSANINEIIINDALDNDENIYKFYLDGLEYRHLSGEKFNYQTLKKWLNKIPKEEAFKPQPYKQMAKVLRNMGHHEDANNIMIEYNDIITSKSENWFMKKLKQIYGFTAGYGYKPMRVIFSMFLIWLFCSLFYWNASKVAVFAPTNPLIFQKKDYYQCNVEANGTALSDIFNWKKYNNANNWIDSKVDGEYTTFNPFMYSLDVILPIVDLQVEKDWGQYVSSDNGTLNDFTRWIMWFEILFGWIYSLILVAILSGLAKNEKD